MWLNPEAISDVLEVHLKAGEAMIGSLSGSVALSRWTPFQRRRP